MSAIAGRVLLIPKGAYNALTTYNLLDFVTYGADSYVCKQTSTGNAPTNTTYWQLLAKGSTDADQIGYDNTASGLSATDVQAAVDELASEKQDKDLSSPIVVGGVSKSTVEGALSGLNGYAEDNISAIVNVYGAKNLNTYPYQHTTKTENGITFTDNGDGTITVSGTASAEATFYLHMDDSLTLKKGTYILTGCPAGGSLSTYELGCSLGDEIGNGLTFTISNDRTFGILIVIASGTAISTPITFKPMLRDARITDDTYAPYAMTNRELTERAEAHNGGTSVALDSYTSSGNKYTFPSDGYVCLNSGSAASGAIRVVVCDSSNRDLALEYMNVTDTYQLQSVFVKRGMCCYVATNSTGSGNVTFYPINN